MVEARRVARDALDAELPHELIGRDDRLVVARAPAEQGHVVAQRLGQVALVAQLLHGRRAVTLGELLAVRAMQQRQVRVHRRLRAERLEHEQLLRRVGEVVLAAHDVRDLRVEVVDRDGEVVEDAAVGARDDGVVEMHVGERRVPADEVVHDGLALVGHAQADRAALLRLAPEAALRAVLRLVGVDLGLRGGRAVGVAVVEQPLQHLLVALGARDLADRPLVVVELEPAQGVEDLLDVLRGGALAVGIFDPQHERPAVVSREQPVVQRRAGAADVQRAGRRRSEAKPHAQLQYENVRCAVGARRRPGRHVLIGAHVSPAGGPANAIVRGTERGARAIQIFNQNPRAWAPRIYSGDEVAAFRAAMAASKIDALLDPRRLPAQLRLDGPGDPREDAAVADELAAGRLRPRRARRRPASGLGAAG